MPEFTADLVADNGIDFHSDAIETTAYNREDKTLYVEFQSGGEYVYSDVEESTYNLFVGADSLGRFYRDHISGQFTSEKGTWWIDEREQAEEETVPDYVADDRVNVIYGHGWDGPATVIDVNNLTVVVKTDDGRIGGFTRTQVEPLDEPDLKPTQKWLSVPEGETPDFATGPNAEQRFSITWTDGSLTYQPEFTALSEADLWVKFEEAVEKAKSVGFFDGDREVVVKAVTRYFD